MADDPESIEDEEDLSDDEWEALERRKPRRAKPIGQAQSRGRFVVAACFLIAAGAAIQLLEIPFPLDFNDPSGTFAIPIVLAAIALVLGLAGLRGAMVGGKYGTPMLDYVPPLLGQRFEAAVTLDKPVAATGDWTLTLSCMHRTSDPGGGADGGSSRYFRKWHQSWTVPHAQVAATGKVPVSVQLPPPNPEWGTAQSQTYWALAIRAPAAGTDFHAEFQPQIYVP